MDVRTKEGLVSALASSIGDEAALRVVEINLAEIGLGAHLTTAEGIVVLQRIDARGGPAGLAAQLVLSRIERSENGSRTSTFSSLRPPASDSVPLAEIAAQLAVAVGVDRSEGIVQHACAALNILGPRVTCDEAVQILDHVELTCAPAATAARFAKVKYLLK